MEKIVCYWVGLACTMALNPISHHIHDIHDMSPSSHAGSIDKTEELKTQDHMLTRIYRSNCQRNLAL